MYQDIQTEGSLLKSIRRIASNFGKARAHETLDLTDNAVHSLTIPSNCHYAQIRIGTTSAAANTPIAWYLLDGGTPSAGVGIPLLGWEMLDISDYENLKNFKIIAVAGTEHVYAQYFNIQY